MESKKRAGVAIFISDKVDIKATKIKRDKEGHYILVKGSIKRRANYPKYIHTQNRSAHIYKASS